MIMLNFYYNYKHVERLYDLVLKISDSNFYLEKDSKINLYNSGYWVFSEFHFPLPNPFHQQSVGMVISVTFKLDQGKQIIVTW